MEEEEKEDLNDLNLKHIISLTLLQNKVRQMIARKQLAKLRRDRLRRQVIDMGFTSEKVEYGLKYANSISGVVEYIIKM